MCLIVFTKNPLRLNFWDLFPYHVTPKYQALNSLSPESWVVQSSIFFAFITDNNRVLWRKGELYFTTQPIEYSLHHPGCNEFYMFSFLVISGTWRSSELSSAPCSCSTSASSIAPSLASTGTSRIRSGGDPSSEEISNLTTLLIFIVKSMTRQRDCALSVTSKYLFIIYLQLWTLLLMVVENSLAYLKCPLSVSET